MSGGGAPGGSALPRAVPSLPGPLVSCDRLNELAVELPSPLRECGGTYPINAQEPEQCAQMARYALKDAIAYHADLPVQGACNAGGMQCNLKYWLVWVSTNLFCRAVFHAAAV